MSHPTPASLVRAAHSGDVGHLRTALNDTHAHHRVLALSGLSKLGAATSADIDAAAIDPDRSVRHRVAQLGARDDSVSVRVLLALLDDTEFAVAETAAWALGERFEGCTGDLLDRFVLDALCRHASEHPHPMVRESCVAALGSIGDERGLPTILAGCHDKPAVRRRAVLALAPFEGDNVDAALHKALSDRDWQVRQAAEDLLGVAGPSGPGRETPPRHPDSATGVAIT